MKQMRFLMLVMMAYCMNVQAQIGYQISLLNTATGEPRANETVNVTVTLTNNEGGVIYTGTQSATTNDFGVLSLTIGDANTFKDVDLTKLPFFVEVTANGMRIGKSQVLSVPVAEAARKLIPEITKEELCGKEWVSYYVTYERGYDKEYYIFDSNGNYRLMKDNNGNIQVYKTGAYEIEGKTVYIYEDYNNVNYCYVFRYRNNKLYMFDD